MSASRPLPSLSSATFSSQLQVVFLFIFYGRPDARALSPPYPFAYNLHSALWVEMFPCVAGGQEGPLHLVTNFTRILARSKRHDAQGWGTSSIISVLKAQLSKMAQIRTLWCVFLVRSVFRPH